MSAIAEPIVVNEIVPEEMKVVWIPVERLKPTAFNPTVRTEDNAAMRALIESVRKVGVHTPLSVTSDDYVLDGNRRLAAAKVAQRSLVPCIISKLGLHEGWALANAGDMPISKAQWLEAYVKGMPIAFVPKETRALIVALEEMVGPSGLQRLVQLRISPTIVVVARRVVQYVIDEKGITPSGIVFWLVDFHMQRPVVEAMREETPASVIARAIREDKPLRRGFVV